MDLQDFICSFAEQFDETDPSDITASTVFQDLDEWDSLITLAVLNMTEKKFGKTITFDELKKCITVEDLFTVAKNK